MKFCLVAVSLLAAAALMPAKAGASRCALQSHAAGHEPAGQPIVCKNARVAGDVDLARISRLGGPFVCKGCTFEGRINASGLVFRSRIDLTGSTLERGIDLSGSTLKRGIVLDATRFEGPAIFGSLAGKQTAFEGPVDVTFATFDDLADFDEAHFAAKADFRSTRFRSVARFRTTTFDDVASFPSTTFGREGLFERTSFTKRAAFDGATFGAAADFRQASFGSAACFVDSSFRGSADFSQTSMAGLATFDDARFGANLLFREAQFLRPLVLLPNADDEICMTRSQGAAAHVLSPGQSLDRLSFDHTAIAGNLDLAGSKLERSAQFLSLSTRSLSFDRVEFGDAAALFMQDLAADAISLDPAEVEYLRSADDVGEADPQQQRDVLKLVESTAKDRGDIARANRAHYRLQVLASVDDPLPQRIADFALYRWVAGYFVRPFRPLVWYGVFIVLGAFLRARRPPQKPRDGPRPPSSLWERFVHALVYTVIPGGDDKTPPLRRVELGVHAVLLGCFLLALANTNPTLRQMIDGLLG